MILSRRGFVRSTLGAAAVANLQAATQKTSSVRDSSFDPWVEVVPANFRHNVSEVSRRVAGRPILAVIKNNGYGAGVVNVARILEREGGIAGFAVVKLHEAHSLLDAGIRKPVLLMGPCEPERIDEAVARGVRPMVYTDIGAALEKASARLQRPVPIHICVDTGIGRVGTPYRTAAPFVKELAAMRSVKIEGIMMTFTEDPEFDREQLGRFRELCRRCEAGGATLGRKHAASSYGLFQHEDAFLDMVRPGMALYGVYPELQFRASGVLNLRPALRLKTRIVYVKRLPKGDSAGYNRAYVAKEDVWIATLPVGHADGLPRTAARKAQVRIGETVYPIVASISASHCIVEIGAESRVRAGDVATIFDDREGSRPEDFGAASETSVYDLTMHLNALLPRRIV